MTRRTSALWQAGRGVCGPLLALSLLVLGLFALSPFVLGLPASGPLPALGQEATGETVLTPQKLLDNLKAKTYSGKRIDLLMSKVSLQAVMVELEKAAGFRFDMDPAIDDKVTYQIRDIPWDEALAVVLSDNALRIDINLEGDGFKVYRGDKYVVAFHDPAGRFRCWLFDQGRLQPGLQEIHGDDPLPVQKSKPPLSAPLEPPPQTSPFINRRLRISLIFRHF